MPGRLNSFAVVSFVFQYEDFQQFVNDLLVKKSGQLETVVSTALNESVQRAISNFGSKHFDDASLVAWQLKCGAGASGSSSPGAGAGSKS
jgi:hypothetical protein